jgi:lysophospholipase L1-like esterase
MMLPTRRSLAAYDNDGLHPNMAGYKAMAEAIPLSLFENK